MIFDTYLLHQTESYVPCLTKEILHVSFGD